MFCFVLKQGMCIISANLDEEDTVYSVLLIIILMMVEFSKHFCKHICFWNTDFGIFNPRALSINVASPATLPRNGYVNGTVGNVIELVDHLHHTPTQNDVFRICKIKKF